MSKLHELLAVEPGLENDAKAILAEVAGVFASGVERLVGQTRRYRAYSDEGRSLPKEDKALASTVNQEGVG